MDKNQADVVDLAAYWGARYQLTYKGHRSICGVIDSFTLDGIEQAFLGGSHYDFHIELKSLSNLSEQDQARCAVIGGSHDQRFSLSMTPNLQLWVDDTPATNQGAIIQYLQRKHYYVPGTLDERLVTYVLL